MTDKHAEAQKREGREASGVNALVKWLQWPKKPWNCYVPLYVISWRLLWSPVMLLALWLAWLSIAIAYGPKKAMEFWRYVT